MKSATLGQRLRRGQRGAAALEFALVAGPLAGLAMGILDFGWLYGERLQLNQVAREATRLAAVNYGDGAADQTGTIIQTACDRIGGVTGLKLTMTRLNGNNVGSVVRVRATAPTSSSSGMYDFMLDGGEMEIRYEARLEQPASWSNITDATCT